MPTVAKCSFSPNITTPNTLIMDDKDALIKSLQGEIFSLQDVIKSRDNEIFKLRREIHKLKVIIIDVIKLKIYLKLINCNVLI